MSSWDEKNNSGSGKGFGGGGSRYNNNYSYEDAGGEDDGGYRRGGQSGRGGRGRGRGRGGGGGRGFGDNDDFAGDSYGRGGNRGGFGGGGRNDNRYEGNESGGYDNRRGNVSRGRGGGRGSGGRGGGGGGFGGNDAYDYHNSNDNDNQRGGGGFGGRGRGGGRGGSRGGGGGTGGDYPSGGDRDRDSNAFNNNKGEQRDGADDTEKPREFYIPPEPSNDETEIFSSGISSGINFSKYDNIPVKVSGDKPPPQIDSFVDAGLRDFVLNNIKKSGYKVPTPIQKAAIPVIHGGRDLMACAQTGSGKTAAFLVPIISRLVEKQSDLSIGKPHALIISPTRELTIQIYNEARKFAHGSYLKISIVYGGTSSKYQSENVAKGCHILICTPGRLHDFVSKCFITFEHTRFVVLDEADRMLDMGFKDSINQIMTHETMSPIKSRQTLMFSATFPEDIQRLAGEYLSNYVFVAVGVVGGACSDVSQKIYEVKKFQKRAKLMDLLGENAERTIVFVETKRGADFLASLLSETDYPTTSIHGDRLQRQRELALADFKSGKMKVLIATSVAARGLDIKNVDHVINYDMPAEIDEYVHRIGRTGRVGNNGRATSFFDPEHDSRIAGALVKILKGAGQIVPDFLHRHEGGFGGGYTESGFGGRDYRRQQDHHGGGGHRHLDGPRGLEEEEDWN